MTLSAPTRRHFIMTYRENRDDVAVLVPVRTDTTKAAFAVKRERRNPRLSARNQCGEASGGSSTQIAVARIVMARRSKMLAKSKFGRPSRNGQGQAERAARGRGTRIVSPSIMRMSAASI